MVLRKFKYKSNLKVQVLFSWKKTDLYQVVTFFLYNNKENNKHYRLKAVYQQGTSGDITRNTAPEKK